MRILMDLAPPLTYEMVVEAAEADGWDVEPIEDFDPSNYAAEEYGLKDVWATVEEDSDGVCRAIFPCYPEPDPEAGEVTASSPREWPVPTVQAGVVMVMAYRRGHLSPERLRAVLTAEIKMLSPVAGGRTVKCKELLRAEAALAAAREEVADDIARAATMRARVKELDHAINAHLAPYRTAVKEAGEIQGLHLTAWQEDGPQVRGLRLIRKHVTASGAVDTSYWSAAWLRRRLGDDGVWRMALDHSVPGELPRRRGIVIPGETDEEFIAAADALLREAGWTLSDGEGEEVTR